MTNRRVTRATGDGSATLPVEASVRFELEDLYARYIDVVDSGDLETWPEFFTDVCLYEVIAAENHDRDLPLATMRCESKGMLRDRVRAIAETAMFVPRRVRHLVGPLLVRSTTEGALIVRANYAVFETLPEDMTRILNVGRYDDVVVEDDGFRFRQRRCIYDSSLIPNSLVFPI